MIGIIAAIDIEVEAIVNRMDTFEKKNISGLEVYEGTLSKKEIIVIKSGVGKVAAAMSTTILLEHYQVSYIINIGTAGGIETDQHILDVVISNKVVMLDYDVSPIDGPLGKGKYFDIDEYFITLCSHVFKEMNIPYHIGSIGSSDRFIVKEDIEAIKKEFPQVMCCEMEASAIAQVANHYDVSYIVIRSLSDVAYKEDSFMDFKEYAIKASQRSALFCEKILFAL